MGNRLRRCRGGGRSLFPLLAGVGYNVGLEAEGVEGALNADGDNEGGD